MSKRLINYEGKKFKNLINLAEALEEDKMYDVKTESQIWAFNWREKDSIMKALLEMNTDETIYIMNNFHKGIDSYSCPRGK